MKKFITILLFISFATIVSGQDDGFYGPSEKSDPKQEMKEKRQQRLERWAFGGNFWLAFGTNSYVELSPVVLYRATPRLMIGPGFTYIYENNKTYGYETSTYGPRAIANFSLIQNLDEMLNINIGNIVLHAEYEYLSIEKLYIDPFGDIFSDGRTWINTMLVGGGIYQPLGRRGGLSLIVLYNIIENEFSPYTNPVIRVGFYF
jgi:hypothetical protein